MATVEHLTHVGGLVEASIKTGMDQRKVVTSQYMRWYSLLNALDKKERDALDCDAAKYAILHGPWTTKQKQKLCSILHIGIDLEDAEECMDSSASEAIAMNRRSHNCCERFENYMTAKDWVRVRKSAGVVFGICQVLARRAHLLNMRLPSEPTLFRMMQIIAHVMEMDVTQDWLKNTKETLRALLKNMFKRCPKDTLPSVPVFPFSASELSTELYNAAYDVDEDPPVDVDMPELDIACLGLKTRSPKADHAWLASVPIKYRQLIASTDMTSSKRKLEFSSLDINKRRVDTEEKERIKNGLVDAHGTKVCPDVILPEAHHVSEDDAVTDDVTLENEVDDELVNM